MERTAYTRNSLGMGSYVKMSYCSKKGGHMNLCEIHCELDTILVMLQVTINKPLDLISNPLVALIIQTLLNIA
jgi:hypothetical protein